MEADLPSIFSDPELVALALSLYHEHEESRGSIDLDLQSGWEKKFFDGSVNPLTTEPVTSSPGQVREGPIPGATLIKSILGVDWPG